VFGTFKLKPGSDPRKKGKPMSLFIKVNNSKTKTRTRTQGELMDKRPTWELRNMVKALSFHPWSNTPEEKQRLKAAKLELAKRSHQKKLEIINSRS
tara:strand:+ start:178 stop:465 length:288 start_codon:yes stop_codon:yes gene_type:complete